MKKNRSIFSVINEYRKQIPVNLNSLLKELEIELQYANLKKDISGVIQKHNDSYRIIVNENHPKTRQRFTIAHELGHFILHRDLINDGIYDNMAYRCEYPNEYNNPNIGSYEETEANKMAVNILMPLDMVEKYREDYKNVDENSLVEKMAEVFQVSKQAMAIRLGIRQL